MVSVSANATVEIGAGVAHGPRAVAFATLDIPGEPAATLRLPLRLSVRPALRGRDVGYAALAAAAGAALERGIRRATFYIDDASLADDLREHRSVPGALSVPYVTLRCLLNRFESADVVATSSRGTRDLAARARADAAFAVAA